MGHARSIPARIRIESTMVNVFVISKYVESEGGLGRLARQADVSSSDS